MGRIAGIFTIILVLVVLIFSSCNRDITRTERGVEAPAGSDAHGTTDPRRVPSLGHPDTGPWTGTFPDTAPGGH
ncbi:hypothetical protein RCC89_20240 [Cytophagaceae bacterium ABcell3]|nr:hypothetical protein RCC89_20240 [Cytophagaceae bacterium ABcell3]